MSREDCWFHMTLAFVTLHAFGKNDKSACHVQELLYPTESDREADESHDLTLRFCIDIAGCE